MSAYCCPAGSVAPLPFSAEAAAACAAADALGDLLGREDARTCLRMTGSKLSAMPSLVRMTMSPVWVCVGGGGGVRQQAQMRTVRGMGMGQNMLAHMGTR